MSRQDLRSTTPKSSRRSGRRREVTDEDLGLGLASLGGNLEHLLRDVVGDVRLTAVLADFRRDLVDDHGLAFAMEGDCRRSWPCISVVANDALHTVFLRVLKSGSHSAGSG